MQFKTRNSPPKASGALLLLILVVASCSLVMSMSIDKQPVRVTHRNSGPRYDVDEVERTKLTPGSNQINASPSQQPPNNDADNQPDENREPVTSVPSMNSNDGDKEKPSTDSKEDSNGEPISLGRVSIRRIFLIPMMQPSRLDEQPNEQDSSPSSPAGDMSYERPNPFAIRPLWPFLSPSRPSLSDGRHHLFGADEASRSPSANAGEEFQRPQVPAPAASGEREDSMRPQGQQRPPFDPIQMMIDMMHQAISSQLVPQLNGANNEPTNSLFDLNREAATRTQANNGGEIEKPTKLIGQNETNEEVIEIDGKNYLRKTVIQRHVGKNIIFTTRHVLFVPMNETDSIKTTTAIASGMQPVDITTTSRPAASEASDSTEVPVIPTASSTSNSPIAEEPTTTTARTIQTTPVASTTESDVTTGKQQEAELTTTSTVAPVNKETPADSVEMDPAARPTIEVEEKADKRFVDTTETSASSTAKPSN